MCNRASIVYIYYCTCNLYYWYNTYVHATLKYLLRMSIFPYKDNVNVLWIGFLPGCIILPYMVSCNVFEYLKDKVSYISSEVSLISCSLIHGMQCVLGMLIYVYVLTIQACSLRDNEVSFKDISTSPQAHKLFPNL